MHLRIVLDVLNSGFKELTQRASSLFPSGEPLKTVTVELRFALNTSFSESGLSWILIALFSFWGKKIGCLLVSFPRCCFLDRHTSALGGAVDTLLVDRT